MNPVRTLGSGNKEIYVLIWSGIALLTIAIHAIISDEMLFADSWSYVLYLDNIFFYREHSWFLFEPLSKLNLLFFRWLLGNSIQSVFAAHYLISIVYLIGVLAIFPPSKGNWRGLIMAFALYGPQLAFVTVRATPAYMIAGVAVMQAVRGQNRAFLFAGLAIMFHVSAVLALIPIAALFFKARLRWLAVFHRPRILFGSLAALAVIFLIVGPTIFRVTQTVFLNIPFLGKYLVFAVGMSDAGGASSIIGSFAVGHFVLLACITVFTAAFMLLDDRSTRSGAIFVLVSYTFYLFVFFAFSPIAAFRQTPFWALPAFSIFPWHRVGWNGIGNLLFFALATGMFIFQFSRVI